MKLEVGDILKDINDKVEELREAAYYDEDY
jgi:hypothetical protein